MTHAPFRVAFATASGESLDEDDPERGHRPSRARAVKVWKRLRDDEHVYGFGEKTGRLDKRGRQLGGYALHDVEQRHLRLRRRTPIPIYASVPFFMVLRDGPRPRHLPRQHLPQHRSTSGHESQDLLSFGAEDGELDYYFIDGPAPKRVIERYTALTGRMPLPPRWALGYHQCRYSYYPESKVRFIADNFRERQIPADVDLARHPLPGRLQALHLGPRALPRPEAG